MSNPFWRMSATLVELRGKQKSLELVLEKAGSKTMHSQLWGVMKLSASILIVQGRLKTTI